MEPSAEITNNITRSEFWHLIMHMMMVRRHADTLDEFLATYDLPGRMISFRIQKSPYIYATSQLGIANGTSNGLFTPDQEITWEEAATVLARLAKKLWSRTGENEITFADMDQVSSWAKGSVLFASSLASLNGMWGMSNLHQKDPIR